MVQPLYRPRLLERIAALLEEGHLFISAPAGYGKTTLLQSLQTERPFSYHLPLTPADGDPAVLRQRLEPLLHAENTLLLDDVHHLLQDDGAVVWLQTQMRRPHPRWILAGRQPLFPATDLALFGRIQELTAADLAFDERETRLWLGERRDKLATWQQRLEGWPLGMGLLKNLEGAADPRPIAEKQLFTYLTEQVLAGLPPELYRFMLATAVPLAFTLDLAAHLLPEVDPHTAVQTLLSRNLFLFYDPQSDSYRYHDLIRAFLRQQQAGEERVMARVVAWLRERGRREEAVEHALAGGLWETAALLLAAPETFVSVLANGRFLTHHRWISSLPPEILAGRPRLLLRDGAALFHLRDRRPEAWSCLERGLALAAAGRQSEDYRLGLRYMAFFHGDEGRIQAALALYRQLLDLPDLVLNQKIAPLQDMIGMYAYRGDYDRARQTYLQVVELKRASQEPAGIVEQTNYAALVLAARGRWAEARALLLAVTEQAAAAQNYQDLLVIRRNLAHLLLEQGDWDGARASLAAVDEIQARIDLPDERIRLIQQHDRVLLAVGEGRLAEAAALLREGEESETVKATPLLRLLFAGAAVWLRRRQGDWEAAVQAAGAVLDRPSEYPYYEGRLALERDIAALLPAAAGAPQLSPQSRALIPLRARAELVRLRMLLTVLCWREGRSRWRRLAKRALAEGERPLFAHLLTTRDPELAAEFWKIMLLEGEQVEKAEAALVEIGLSAPLLPLLAHPEPAVRGRAASLLARIGREEGMPALAAALEEEKEPAIREALRAALLTLETAPPPLLEVRLLGGFSLQRGEVIYQTADFHRPIVARLLQYFVLHAGRPLARDRILEALWPDGDPQKAAVTFRTVNSHLRGFLEPNMRPRGPNRYIVVERDIFRFDPDGVVSSDAARFAARLEGGLLAGDLGDAHLGELVRALADYAPLLPDLPYADWLLEPRQRLEDLYLEGCLSAAEGYLVRREWAESRRWLQQALHKAPWLEKGWQLLMRAYARQGQRGLALKAFREAAGALERELGVGPADLTIWLHDRVQRGEPI